MRTVSMLVGLSLVALAATARAQEVAPAAATASPVAASAAASAEPAPAAAESAPREKKVQLGVSLLSMGLGSFTSSPGGELTTSDAAFAGGVGLSFGYEVIPGLTMGVAPQAIINVKPKEAGGGGAKEYDLLARVAYSFSVVESIALYLEALPGYSFVFTPDDSTAKGLVLGFGGGAEMALTDQVAVNLGVGYQIGYQKVEDSNGRVSDYKASYLRVGLGVVTRF